MRVFAKGYFTNKEKTLKFPSLFTCDIIHPTENIIVNDKL